MSWGFNGRSRELAELQVVLGRRRWFSARRAIEGARALAQDLHDLTKGLGHR